MPILDAALKLLWHLSFSLRLHSSNCYLLQAAYAYNVLSSQAAQMVTAMDKMWTGPGTDPEGQGGSASVMTAATAQQQAARLQAALDSKDGDDVYAQVSLLLSEAMLFSLCARPPLWLS